MSAFLKRDPTRLGLVTDVYVTDSGQRRINVSFADGAVQVDADVTEFEFVLERSFHASIS